MLSDAEKEFGLHEVYEHVCNTEMQCNSAEDRTMTNLGTAYIQLYNMYYGGDDLSFHNDQELAIMADSCLELYGSFKVTPRDEWEKEWVGMYTLMTCFMYLYKRLSKGIKGQALSNNRN